ncbi:MAG: hypothetical protein FI687_01365 [SAR202 cluster bacterium]|nr:hypothetical protein [SAR202 cluster bacterium]|tara:strand:- start:28700 stop:29149 length:450 start_codon:yes stop_codon:yes gene_type:complete
MKFLILKFYIFTTLILLLSCAKSTSSIEVLNGQLISPEVIVNQTKGSSYLQNAKMDKVIQLPLEVWSSFEYRMLAIYSTKHNHCVIDGRGDPVPIDARVKVIDEATCLYVRFNDPGESPRTYPLGLMKIKVIDTGQEGWIWNTAVALDK